jgi:hypothetical protein
MKDFIASVVVGVIVLLAALSGFILVLITQPLFWFAVMTAILARKL